MRVGPVLLFATSVGAVVACGGSKDQDVISGTSTSSSGGTTSSSGTTASSSGATSSNGGTTSTSSGGTKDSGTACSSESEPNDELRQANLLEGSMCGALVPSSETDSLTFTLPEGTKTMDLTYEGDVRLRISVGNQVVDLTPTSNPPIPFVVGKPYLIRITSAVGGGDPKVSWRVNLVHG